MFGKLFASMYDGTLAMRGPWQALVTFQQMIILADRTGIVDMTADAIARRTTIPLDIIKIGIIALEQDDKDSRTPHENGRRILRLDPEREWGWQIVNYEKYRKIRSADERREYMADLMRKRRHDSVSERKQQLAKLAHADAEADALNPRASCDARFVEFWDAYPRKKSKGTALKAWGRIKPTQQLFEAIIGALSKAKSSPDWKRDNGQFIPYPASWLNARGWEDEQTDEKRLFPI